MMKRSLVFLIAGLVVLVAVACGGGSTSPSSGDQGGPKAGTGVGDLARSFDVTTTDGKQVSLDSLKGKPFVIYFFASW